MRTAILAVGVLGLLGSTGCHHIIAHELMHHRIGHHPHVTVVHRPPVYRSETVVYREPAPTRTVVVRPAPVRTVRPPLPHEILAERHKDHMKTLKKILD